MERRAEQLLSLFSEEEIALLRSDIAHSDRETLLQLCDILCENRVDESESPSNNALFESLFGRPWSKKEDYLLRNELRLLSERCYALIVRQSEAKREDRSRHDQMLLRGLLDRGGLKVFVSLCGKLREEARERLDYRGLLQINTLWFEYLMQYREITPEGMAETHELLLENLELVKRIYRIDISENQHRRVVAEQNLMAMGREMEETTIGLDTTHPEEDPPLARFNDALSRTHNSRGAERIEHARGALAEILPVAEKYQAKTLFGYAILASVLYADGEYQEARSIFTDGLSFADEQGIDPPPEMLFNYAGTLMRMEEYQDVLALLDEYHDEFESRPKLRFRSECFRCFCHIFLNDPVSAYGAIPPDLKRRAESEHNYFRFIYLILPYLNNDPESALREARNFLVYFNRKKDALQFPQEKEIAHFFKSFYTTIYNEVDEEKRKKSLAELQGEIEDFKEREPVYRDYLYVRWLGGELTDNS